MELSAKYAYAVYEKRSFSLAAKELYVSQPALSAMIAKLERELGFKIFQRNRREALSLTPKGRIYIDMISAQMSSEKLMKLRLEQIDNSPAEILRIGGIMFCAQSILSDICLRLKKELPNVNVYVNAGTVGPHGVLHDKLARGELELLLSYRIDGVHCDAVPLFTNRTIIALRRDHISAEKLLPYSITREQALKKNYSEDKIISDPSLFEDVEFLINDENPSPSLISFLGDYYKSASVLTADSRNGAMQFYMMKAGLGAVLLGDINLVDPIFDDDLIYAVPDIGSSQSTLYLLWRKGHQLSEPAKRFSELLMDYFSELTETSE